MKNNYQKFYGISLSIVLFLSACAKEDTEPEQNPVFTIGQEYLGGIIFYIDDTEQHGLIAYTADIGRGEWGCFYNDGSNPDFEPPTIPIAQNDGIGFGQQNSLAILNFCDEPEIAARIASNFNVDGFDDWYLPSIDELALIYERRELIGGFPDLSIHPEQSGFIYASSSEAPMENDGNGGFFYSSSKAFYFNDFDYFSGERAIIAFKDNGFLVRPIRSF